MTNHVLVNYNDHKDVKVITKAGKGFGDNLWHTPTFPLEFRSIQHHYPIFFTKDADTGQFLSVALLGFEDGENLYIQDDTWLAGYIPLTIKRQPFLIGQQSIQKDGEQVQNRVVHIDLDSPRVSKTEGQALFEDVGTAPSDYLSQVADMLETIHIGLQQGAEFIEVLLKHELIESFTLDIELNDGSRHNMIGFYTIAEETLANLPQDTINALHAKGFLQAIYMIMASQSSLRDLIDLKNKTLTAHT